jgi:hypothetical protein
VLVGTVSIDKSEELSRRLRREGIQHTVLNAKYHDREAEIVAQAGKLGAVTISTNMAGRGTDIMLGGNPEYMAKKEMRKLEIPEELIAMATGTAEIDDEAVKEARAVYKELYQKYKLEIQPEADKVREAGLTLEAAESNHTPGIREYPLTIECRILYAQDQELAKIPEEIREKMYPQDVPGTNPMANRDYHTMYVGQILDAYIIR